MAWKIQLERNAERELDKLNPRIARRILTFLRDRVAPLNDARSMGEALKGSKLGTFWKYRVGDHRIIAKIEDAEITILVLKIGNRRDVYRSVIR